MAQASVGSANLRGTIEVHHDRFNVKLRVGKTGQMACLVRLTRIAMAAGQQVVYPHDGKLHELGGLLSMEEAEVVCDMLTGGFLGSIAGAPPLPVLGMSLLLDKCTMSQQMRMCIHVVAAWLQPARCLAATLPQPGTVQAREHCGAHGRRCWVGVCQGRVSCSTFTQLKSEHELLSTGSCLAKPLAVLSWVMVLG
jgi:hypothetical protein